MQSFVVMRSISHLEDFLQNSGCCGVVIVPAFNEEHYVPRLLDSLAAQAMHGIGNVAVVVATNNCTDNTVRRCAAHHLAEKCAYAVLDLVVTPPNVGLVRKLVADAVAASGPEWILFMDADDYVPGHAYFTTLHQTLATDHGDCFAGSCDEFADMIAHIRHTNMSTDSTKLAIEEICSLLSFYSTFRCRLLPRDIPIFRHTNGTNSLITTAAYRRIGGIAPTPVGSDSSLGDRILASGLDLGFIDYPVVTSARKHLSLLCSGGASLGGFIFYPDVSALPMIRDLDVSSLQLQLTASDGFSTIARDLAAYTLFTLNKRKGATLEQYGGSTGILDGLICLFNKLAHIHQFPVRLARRHLTCEIIHSGLHQAHTFSITEDAIHDFWKRGIS